MALLSIDNGVFSFGDKKILDGVSFSINPGDKIGLVGDNGTGKSTLLKLLMGQLSLDSGTVTKSRSLGKIGYIEQDIPTELENQTLYDVLLRSLPQEEQLYNSWKVDVALDDIGTPEEIRHKKMSELSGGWRRLALIARTNLDEPDLLILDEPTNYLDLEKILHLENWFASNVKCPYLLISHDRQFLDNVTSRTVTLRNGKLIDIKQPFSVAREIILKQDILDAEKRQAQEDEIKRLERASKRVILWGKYNTSLAKKGKAIQTRADKMKQDLTDVYKEKRRDVNLRAEELRPNTALRIQDVTISTPDERRLFGIQELFVAKGDRIALLGMNGTGKTQFLKRLERAYSEQQSLTSGIRFNPQVNMGYFDQNMDVLPRNESIYNYMVKNTKLPDSSIRSALVGAGFPYKEHDKKISQLSFGERARFLFLALHSLHKNFFILDEPTNHLDIDGQEKLEDELMESENTTIFVSHDRHFVRTVANRFVMIDKGRLVEISEPEEFYNKLKFYNSNVSMMMLPEKTR